MIHKLINKILQGNENVEIQFRLYVFLNYDLEENLIIGIVLNRIYIIKNNNGDARISFRDVVE